MGRSHLVVLSYEDTQHSAEGDLGLAQIPTRRDTQVDQPIVNGVTYHLVSSNASTKLQPPQARSSATRIGFGIDGSEAEEATSFSP